ncbi:MAG: hypothetical protein ACRYG8_54430 [Janthinobacterium lividum]
MTGYQPRDTGPQAPPPHGGSSAKPPPVVRNVRTSVQPSDWMPQTTMNIPMPAGAALVPGAVERARMKYADAKQQYPRCTVNESDTDSPMNTDVFNDRTEIRHPDSPVIIVSHFGPKYIAAMEAAFAVWKAENPSSSD